MPQLDITTYSSQIFWLIVSFFSMLFIMSKFIVPRIREMIDLRQRKISENLDNAAKIKEQAEEALQKYQQALKEATDKANKSLEKTQNELKALISSKQDELSKTLSQQIKEGEEAINKSKDQALGKIKEISASLAVEVIKKIDISGIDAKDISNAVKNIEV